MVNDYLRVLTQSEGASAVLYSKAHSEVNQGQSGSGMDRERSWTICIVFNSKKNKKIEQATRAQASAGVSIAVPANCKMALESEQQIKLTLTEKELNGDPL